jgi:hypothetical protein
MGLFRLPGWRNRGAEFAVTHDGGCSNCRIRSEPTSGAIGHIARSSISSSSSSEDVRQPGFLEGRMRHKSCSEASARTQGSGAVAA